MKKLGCGIDYFFIQQNPLNKNALQTMIKRLDGSTIDFSWLQCCRFKDRSIDEDLSMAMRFAVQDEILKFPRRLLLFVISARQPMMNSAETSMLIITILHFVSWRRVSWQLAAKYRQNSTRTLPNMSVSSRQRIVNSKKRGLSVTRKTATCKSYVRSVIYTNADMSVEEHTLRR